MTRARTWLKAIPLLASAILLAFLLGVDMTPDIPPCLHEDGSGQTGWCYWDSSAHGNKWGTGIYIYRDGELIDQR